MVAHERSPKHIGRQVDGVLPHAHVRVVKEIIRSRAWVAIKRIEPPAARGAVCLRDGDTGVPIVAAIHVGVISRDAQDVTPGGLIVTRIRVEHDHAAARAAVGTPEAGVKRWPDQAVAALVKHLEAGIDAHDNMIPPHHDVWVWRHALLRLRVVNRLETLAREQGSQRRVVIVNLYALIHALLQRFLHQRGKDGFAHRPFVNFQVGPAIEVSVIQQVYLGWRSGNIHDVHHSGRNRFALGDFKILAGIRQAAAALSTWRQGHHGILSRDGFRSQ